MSGILKVKFFDNATL